MYYDESQSVMQVSLRELDELNQPKLVVEKIIACE